MIDLDKAYYAYPENVGYSPAERAHLLAHHEALTTETRARITRRVAEWPEFWRKMPDALIQRERVYRAVVAEYLAGCAPVDIAANHALGLNAVEVLIMGALYASDTRFDIKR